LALPLVRSRDSRPMPGVPRPTRAKHPIFLPPLSSTDTTTSPHSLVYEREHWDTEERTRAGTRSGRASGREGRTRRGDTDSGRQRGRGGMSEGQAKRTTIWVVRLLLPRRAGRLHGRSNTASPLAAALACLLWPLATSWQLLASSVACCALSAARRAPELRWTQERPTKAINQMLLCHVRGHFPKSLLPAPAPINDVFLDQKPTARGKTLPLDSRWQRVPWSPRGRRLRQQLASYPPESQPRPPLP